VARIEGVLDHDQSIVGLMALDIAAGRRWPIFFDGQRYMGAVEAYLAAAFVGMFGHSPAMVALSPLVFFGLFAAGQYLIWRHWVDRPSGHLAALITVLSAPMPALWAIVPRGGYIEVLFWALPVLGVYRAVTDPGARPLSPAKQAGWGFLLAFGYFLNPLSLILYAALAIDWTLGRHGADLRKERRLDGRWIDSRRAFVIWPLAAGLIILALSVCCHVESNRGAGKSPFVFLLDRVPGPIGPAVGCLGIAGVLGWAAWWTGAGRRIVEKLAGQTAFGFGCLVALIPFLLYNLCVRFRLIPSAQSLPIWIRAPWDIGSNLRDGARALGPLVGCDPGAPASVLIGQGVELPPHVWPKLAQALTWASPGVVTLALGLLARQAWLDRLAWRRFWTLRSEEPTPPTVLSQMVLLVASILYILQATSVNASSVRYLFPVWIVLPGLLACGLRSLGRPRSWLVGAILIGFWTLSQVNLWAEMDRPAPLRPLATALEQRGVRGIVAETPVALMVANLTQGRVGALEYRAKWSRLHDRYRQRFAVGKPVTCVVDSQLSWVSGEDDRGAPLPGLSAWLKDQAKQDPGRVRRAWSLGQFEVWEVDRPLDELSPAEGKDLPSRPVSAKVSALESSTREPTGAEAPCPPNAASDGASSAVPGSAGAG
jgi:hypothetical protein